jgi:uncharacterized protein (TIGR02646 family)
MRSYKKQGAPEILEGWGRSRRPWEDFVQNSIDYESLKRRLVQEQSHLCCYCESTVDDSISHIEHYEPRSRNQNRTYDYTNLACSCNGGIGRDRHCGHKKGADYDPKLFFNPSIEDSGELFLYDAEGGIGPHSNISHRDTQRADYMVSTLSLDCPRLTGMRRSHGRSIVQIIDGFIKANAQDQIEEMARFQLTPDEDGKLQPFYSLSLQLYGQIGRRILKGR